MMFSAEIFNTILTKETLWFVFGIAAVIVGVITLILSYHWQTYGVSTATKTLIQFIYIAGTVLLLVVSFTLFNNIPF